MRLWGVGSKEKAGEAGAMGLRAPMEVPEAGLCWRVQPQRSWQLRDTRGCWGGKGAVWGWVWDRDGVPGEECRVWGAEESGVLPDEQRSSSKGRGIKRREGGSGFVGLFRMGGWCLAAHS